MKFRLHYGVAAAALLAATAAGAAQQQQVTGPISTYWMSAATTSGMAGMGAGGAPSASAIMGQMFGGGRGGAAQANHTLTLQLGSSQRPASLTADHTAAPALRTGPVLPLLSPERAPPREPEPGLPQDFQRPKGKMLIFWGCGDHAGPGQPLVIDFSKIGTGQAIPNMPTINVQTAQPPSPTRFASYGEWPNRRSNNQNVTPQSSLVGPQSVKGSYTPQIDFTLQPGQDFLPPLNITSQNKSPGGGTRITWNPVQGATGYFASLMGAGQDRGETIVMWSSSSARGLAFSLMDYLPPSEVRRLIADKTVMPPQQTECIVPAEVTSQSPIGMLSMIAYGQEYDFSYPPRPADPKVAWNRQWVAKVRTKSSTGAMLGMQGMGEMGGFGGNDDDDRPQQRGSNAAPNRGYPNGAPPQQQQQQPQRGRGIGGALRGLGGLGGVPGF